MKTKKRCLLLALFLVIITTFSLQAKRVPKRKIRQMANGWLSQNSKSLTCDFSQHKVKNVKGYGYFAVVNLKPEGFLVVPVDDEILPVVAFSDKGQFKKFRQRRIKSTLYVLSQQDIKNRIDAVIKARRAPVVNKRQSKILNSIKKNTNQWNYLIKRGEAYENWATHSTIGIKRAFSYPADNTVFPLANLSSISDVRIAPLVNATWSQGSVGTGRCYNYYTPNYYVCGCVATAMAQIMHYHQYPTTGIGQITKTVYINGSPTSRTTRGGNGSGGAYNWGSMPDNPYYANDTQRAQVGALCYDAGVSVSMQYSSSGSGAFSSDVDDALKNTFNYSKAVYMGYSSSGISNTIVHKTMNSNLQAGYPVYMAIRGNGGHAVVTDGWGYNSSTMYHHVNLGWGGSSNAWYNLPYVGTGYNFNIITALVYNIFPDKTGEIISGRITDANGSALSGATVTATGGYSDTTDSKGYYGFIVPSGQSYTVTASYGAATQNQNVTVGTSSGYNCANFDNVNFSNLVQNFSFTATALQTSVVMRWTKPSDCGAANDTVYIRRSTSAYPVNSSDGTEAYTGTGQNGEYKFEDTGLTPGQTYYYRIWWDNSGYADPATGTVQLSATPDNGTLRLYFKNNVTGRIYHWLMNTTGTIKAEEFLCDYPMTAWTPVAMGEIDGDNTTDIIWKNTSNGRMYFWVMGRTGFIDSEGFICDYPMSNWDVVASGMIDADSSMDLIFKNKLTGRMYFWQMNTNGSIKSEGFICDYPMSNWDVVASGMIDADSSMDLIFKNKLTGRMYFWQMNTDGTIKNEGFVCDYPMTKWQVVASGKIDGDSSLDLIFKNVDTGRMYFWQMNTDGTIKSEGFICDYPMAKWQVVASGKIDGDSSLDLIFKNTDTGRAYFWLMNTNGTIKSEGFISDDVMTNWDVVSFGDLNADNTIDVIWKNSLTGRMYYWLLNTDGSINTQGFLCDYPMANWSVIGSGTLDD